ncbi:Homeodomain-containing protein [Pyrenophora teres f. maculata]|nr:Homeodomain-containing protein [Pyrenophora teres f. maculata]
MESDWTFDQFNETDNFDVFNLDSADFGTAGSIGIDDTNFFEMLGIPDDESASHTPWWPSTLMEQTSANVANITQANEPQYISDEAHVDPLMLLVKGNEQQSGIQPFSPDCQPDLPVMSGSGSHDYQRENQMISMGLVNVPLSVTEATEPLRHMPPLETMPDVAQLGVKRRRTSNSPSKTGKKKRQTRIFISPFAQSVLKQHFQSNPYPDKADLALLAGKTHFSIRSIKIWFSNYRARADYACSYPLEDMGEVEHPPGDAGGYPTGALAMPRVTAASLQVLESQSPPSGKDSIERFITTPPSEDPVSPASIKATLELCDSLTSQYDPLAGDQSKGSVLAPGHISPSTLEGITMKQAPRTPSVASSTNSSTPEDRVVDAEAGHLLQRNVNFKKPLNDQNDIIEICLNICTTVHGLAAVAHFDIEVSGQGTRKPSTTVQIIGFAVWRLPGI